jgi:hypothetical protein
MNGGGGVRGEESILCVWKDYFVINHTSFFSHSIPFVVLYVDVKLCEWRDGEGGEEIDQ